MCFVNARQCGNTRLPKREGESRIGKKNNLLLPFLVTLFPLKGLIRGGRKKEIDTGVILLFLPGSPPS